MSLPAARFTHNRLENMDNLEAAATVDFDMRMTSSSNRAAAVVAAQRAASLDPSAMRFCDDFRSNTAICV